MSDASEPRCKLDIYLLTVSGRSLPEALARGHRFGEDVSDYAPLQEARERVLARLEELRAQGRLGYVHENGYVLTVAGTQRRLKDVFGCRLSVQAGRDGGWRHGYVGHAVRLETRPRLHGLDEWIETIEPAERWPVLAEREEVACEVRGHDWDILLGNPPEFPGSGVLGCDRCGARNDRFRGTYRPEPEAPESGAGP